MARLYAPEIWRVDVGLSRKKRDRLVCLRCDSHMQLDPRSIKNYPPIRVLDIGPLSDTAILAGRKRGSGVLSERMNYAHTVSVVGLRQKRLPTPFCAGANLCVQGATP